MSALTPSRPYLVRALHQCILDNQCTPYVLVDTTMPHVSVPEEFIENSQIGLNISPAAVEDLPMDDQGVSFKAHFGGVPNSAFVPTIGILAIHAEGNGQGMIFVAEAGAPTPDKAPPTPPTPRTSPQSSK